MSMTSDVGLVYASTPQFLLPRVEIQRWDSPAILEAKVTGNLAPIRLMQRLRKQAHFKNHGLGPNAE
jgi:hypothetical protein